jgi:hypothetical protein
VIRRRSVSAKDDRCTLHRTGNTRFGRRQRLGTLQTKPDKV